MTMHTAKHTTKIRRAQRLAPFLPLATREIWEGIPAYLVDRLTASELAEVSRCLDAHWHRAVRHATAEIVADGYVWSATHGALLDVVVTATRKED